MKTRLTISISLFLILLSNICAAQIIHSETFSNCPASWTNVTGTGDNDINDFWECSEQYSNVQVTAYGDGYDIDWYISPAFNLNTYDNEVFSFIYNKAFSGGSLELFYSNSFSGDYTTESVEKTNWTSLPISLDQTNGIVNVDLKNISGSSVYLAFKYQGGPNPGESTRYRISNFRIESKTPITGTDCDTSITLNQTNTSDRGFDTYYDSIDGTLKGQDLKTALHNLIKDHKVYTYSQIFTHLSNSIDIRPDDNCNTTIVFDKYSDIPGGTDSYTFIPFEDKDQGGAASQEGMYYNREHTFPKSWWGGNTTEPQYTDMHQVMLSDKVVNSIRGNLPYGEVVSTARQFKAMSIATENGSLQGSNTIAGYTGNVFEPIDEYKGDIARMQLYMAVRYENQIESWTNNKDEVLNNDKLSPFDQWYLDMLIDWHTQDPVSDAEVKRNNEVYLLQNNRNPFIDNPDYVNEIWERVLPVKWKSVNATMINNQAVIKWTTIDEINNKVFVVEKSTDGNSYKYLGAVKSNFTKKYSFTDYTPDIDNYYRIKQINYDGDYSYSDVVFVSNNKSNSISIYPNPVNDSFTINGLDKDYNYRILSILGQEIMNGKTGYNRQINIANIDRGVYHLIIIDNNKIVNSQSIIKE